MVKELTGNIKFILLSIALLTFSLHLVKLSQGRWLIGSDGLGYYAHIRSLVIDHDLDYANEFRDFNPFGHSVQDFSQRTRTGHVANKYPVGPALLWTPFFLIAHFFTLGLNHLGYNGLPADGYSFFYQLFVGLGTICYGILGLYACFRIAALHFSRQTAAFATGAIFLSTNLFYYFVNEPSMSHVLSMFSVTLFLYLCLHDFNRIAPVPFSLCGLAAGLMIMMRYQNALFMIIPCGQVLAYCYRNHFSQKSISTAIKSGLAFLGTTSLAFLPQLVILQILFGLNSAGSQSISAQGLASAGDYSLQSFNFFEPKLFQVLFSPHHGLIYSTPVIFLCLLGLLIFIRTKILQGSILLLCFVLQWYINGAWHDWTFGVAFGGRAFINCTPIFTLGLAALIDYCATPKKRAGLVLGLTLLIGANLSFAAQFILSMVPHAGPVSWTTILKGNGLLLNRCKLKIVRFLSLL